MAARAKAVSGLKGGNGSLMRTAPVALAYLDDPQGAADAALKIGALTHDDPQAGQACQMWTYAIRHAVIEGNFDGVRDYLSVADQEMADYWRPLLDQAENGNPRDFSKNGWVVHALQTAWWAITSTDSSGAQHCRTRSKPQSGQVEIPTPPQLLPAAYSAPDGEHRRYRSGGAASCTGGRGTPPPT